MNRILRDVMTRGVVSVPMDLSIREVAEKMTQQNVSAVTVTDHNGEIMGLISEMDVLKAVMDRTILNSAAETIMSSNIQSVDPSITLDKAASIMMNKGIHRLVVLSEPGVGASDRPVGILSAGDIIREIIKK
ncbi:MAG TPA: CBS domain-containing protein [Candidatus Nanoarchaeia archaeon]|nr:CBS domain-containing protein [Candidatus Nanoarchaeia archaeon]